MSAMKDGLGGAECLLVLGCLVCDLIPPLYWPHLTDDFVGTVSGNIQAGQGPRGSGMENQD